MARATRVISQTKPRNADDASESGYLDGNDKELLACLRAGDDGCYEILVRRFGPQVLATAKRYLRSDADAADCFQDTFLAVFESIDKFEQRSTIATWLRGITINQCLMKIRAQGRRQEDSIEHLLPVFDEKGDRINSCTSKRSCGIGESIDTAQMKRLVRETILELPDTFRVMLLMRDIDGYSTKETATILGISVTAAKTRLHRARTALGSLLRPEMERLKYHADV